MRALTMTIYFLVSAGAVSSQDLSIFVDADYSLNSSSAHSIELGLTTALAEVDNKVAGQVVQIVPYDHRGNVKRSLRTMQSYLESETALVVFGGLHSPPYLENKDFINENRVLTLLPWSAAGPITRAAHGEENWMFRLSVDDFQSGEFFVREAVDNRGCDDVDLLLMDTGWGRANEVSLKSALEERGLVPNSVQFFPSTIGKAAVGSLARKIVGGGADCAILVASASSGVLIVNELYASNAQLRLFSHWGIMGGTFLQNVPQAALRALSLEVLQTCGLRREVEGSETLGLALSRAGIRSGRLSDVAAPTGFVHGYDLGRLLIAAVEQGSQTPEWDGDIRAKRAAVKDALEALRDPVQGILGTYSYPFSPYSQRNRDAHEALGLDDLCMARFDGEGVLVDANG